MSNSGLPILTLYKRSISQKPREFRSRREAVQLAGYIASRFVVTGRGGLPPSPSERVSGSGENDDLPAEPLVDAQGWIINAKDEVELVVNTLAVVPYSPGAVPPICN